MSRLGGKPPMTKHVAETSTVNAAPNTTPTLRPPGILRLVGLIVAALIITVLIYHWWRSAQQEPPSPFAGASIKTTAVQRGDLGIYLDALGTVTPLATVSLYSQITGLVVAVHYTEGQVVDKGDPLIDIDSRPYQALLQEAEGTLEHDQGLLAQAKLDLSRYQQASSQKALARQTFEDQLHVVEQYRGTVKNDLGQVNYAKVQLGFCHLVSPIKGRVGLRLVDNGNTIFAGSSTALVVITQLQPITVVFNVAEDDLDQLRGQIDNPATLAVDAYDRSMQKKVASGTLLTLDNQIDTTTGTVRLRAAFDNEDLHLFPNQFVNTRLLIKTLKGIPLVTSAAIQHNGLQAFVYRVSGEIVKSTNIKVVGTDGDAVAVNGVQPGDVLAATGFDRLQDGTKVQVDTADRNTTPAQSPSKGGL
jgi:multidrug efflux system membrane fusion protein